MPKLQKPIHLFAAIILLVGVWGPAPVPATAEAAKLQPVLAQLAAQRRLRPWP